MVKANHALSNSAQTDNSSKYKSEDEFCSIIGLDILSGKRPREGSKHCENIETSPSQLMWKLRQKAV